MSATPTRLLKLTGRHATGKHRFAVVDADQFGDLNIFAWKAKPNANGRRVYAVRNVHRAGKLVTLRLHRVVLGVEPGWPGDVRFVNGDPLDCRRANLERCGRSTTTCQARVDRQHGRCIACGERFAFWAPGYARNRFCSDACRASHRAALAEAQRQARLLTQPCGWCGQPFRQRTVRQKFCSDICRHRHKNERRRRA